MITTRFNTSKSNGGERAPVPKKKIKKVKKYFEKQRREGQCHSKIETSSNRKYL